VQQHHVEDRLHLDLATCDLGQLIDECVNRYPTARDVVIIAKHLCGNATDFAMKSIGELVSAPLTEGRKWRVVGLFMAPCCHPKAKWEHFSGQPWMHEHKIVQEGAYAEELEEHCPHDWTAVLQALAVSKFGSSLRKELDCRSWRHMTEAMGGELWRLRRLGYHCRRMLEEARAAALRACDPDLDVGVFRYTTAAVTPDNLVIVATRRSADLSLPRPIPEPPVHGVVIRTQTCQNNSKLSTFPAKMVEYLCELRETDEAFKQCMDSACLASMGTSGGDVEAVIFCRGRSSAPSSIGPLLQALSHNPVLARITGQMLPVDGETPNVAAWTPAPDTQWPVRIIEAPSALGMQKQVCDNGSRCGQTHTALGDLKPNEVSVACPLLSPTAHRTIVSAVSVIDGLGWVPPEAQSCVLHWSALPRAISENCKSTQGQVRSTTRRKRSLTEETLRIPVSGFRVLGLFIF
jgi:hypothetical protein